ncbi:MAG: NADH-quinone oxidoreductase subunit N [bacterium]|nr:NADH-quinone oxidoreductase subunit N [bacterium]
MPAHILLALAMLFFFAGKAVPGLRKMPVTPLFLLVLAGAFAFEAMGEGSHEIFFGMIVVDSFSRLYDQIYYLVTAIVVLMLHYSDEVDRDNDWENFGLLSCLLLGMMFMTNSSHLLMAVIGIEMVSLPSYLLVAMNRKVAAAKEASLKYVLFGSFATGIMLYGMSLLFGLTGSLAFADIWSGLDGSVVGSPVYYLAIGMTLAGMAFKVAAVPFHFWCPDAYQAAPTPVTAFLSVAPKVAGLALMMRFFAEHMAVQGESLTLMLSIISMATMTLGNFAALKQTDIKRLLAYSSISHAGFLLMGVTVLNADGRQAVFFYIPIYLLMNLGAFMVVILLSKEQNFQISSFKGAIKANPLLVVAFAVCSFSLAGIPPFAGFVGKFYLFKASLEKGLYLLLLVAGINSVVALFYYVNVLKVMIIDKEAQPMVPLTQRIPLVFVTSCAVPLVFLGIYWVPLLHWAEKVRLFQ